MDVQRVVAACFKILLQLFLGGTEEKCEESWPGLQIPTLH